ncbi:MAG: MBL fold metallo-hydrolase [Candidatus Omnitrophica bacterium]|nr:MBL fold metallo-hydrolase [Candidatus Omnitrophota bacterium]MDD5574718.1 MBL fold metallo-hydrolase [Candidatus Omnitrophota bacterium]
MKILTFVVGELGTNCYVVATRQGRAMVIDPGDETAVITQGLADHALTASLIVNTHGHIDHIAADAALGLPVSVHEDDAAMISDPEKNMMTMFFGTFEPVVPARLLRDGDDVVLDELMFKVIHTPGHTPGCICLFGHGVLFSGDTLFRDGIGRTDFPGASGRKMEESLKRLKSLPPETIVYPGHGPKTTIGREFSKHG